MQKLAVILAFVIIASAAIGSVAYIIQTQQPSLSPGHQVGIDSFSSPVCTNTPSAETCVCNRN